MNINVTLFILIWLVFALTAIGFMKMDQQDMQVCQLSHSFDVCHSTLNP